MRREKTVQQKTVLAKRNVARKNKIAKSKTLPIQQFFSVGDLSKQKQVSEIQLAPQSPQNLQNFFKAKPFELAGNAAFRLQDRKPFETSQPQTQRDIQPASAISKQSTIKALSKVDLPAIVNSPVSANTSSFLKGSDRDLASVYRLGKSAKSLFWGDGLKTQIPLRFLGGAAETLIAVADATENFKKRKEAIRTGNQEMLRDANYGLFYDSTLGTRGLAGAIRGAPKFLEKIGMQRAATNIGSNPTFAKVAPYSRVLSGITYAADLAADLKRNKEDFDSGKITQQQFTDKSGGAFIKGGLIAATYVKHPIVYGAANLTLFGAGVAKATTGTDVFAEAYPYAGPAGIVRQGKRFVRWGANGLGADDSKLSEIVTDVRSGIKNNIKPVTDYLMDMQLSTQDKSREERRRIGDFFGVSNERMNAFEDWREKSIRKLYGAIPDYAANLDNKIIKTQDENVTKIAYAAGNAVQKVTPYFDTTANNPLAKWVNRKADYGIGYFKGKSDETLDRDVEMKEANRERLANQQRFTSWEQYKERARNPVTDTADLVTEKVFGYLGYAGGLGVTSAKMTYNSLMNAFSRDEATRRDYRNAIEQNKHEMGVQTASYLANP
ncbi:MAG: hypothetical protein V4691_02495 [Pseudomonadota bacterium]